MGVNQMTDFAEGAKGDVYSGQAQNAVRSGFPVRRRWRWRHLKNLADGGEGGGFVPTGEPPIGADFGKPGGKNVQEEAGDEVWGWQGHLFERIPIGSVSPIQGDGIPLKSAKAMIA